MSESLGRVEVFWNCKRGDPDLSIKWRNVPLRVFHSYWLQQQKSRADTFKFCRRSACSGFSPFSCYCYRSFWQCVYVVCAWCGVVCECSLSMLAISSRQLDFKESTEGRNHIRCVLTVEDFWNHGGRLRNHFIFGGFVLPTSCPTGLGVQTSGVALALSFSSSAVGSLPCWR